MSKTVDQLATEYVQTTLNISDDWVDTFLGSDPEAMAMYSGFVAGYEAARGADNSKSEPL